MDAKVLIQEIAKALATQKSLDKKDALAFVQSFFDVIITALKQDKYVKIKGLGTFKQIEVESRESMNIHTGERFEIQGHTKITFTPDASLKDSVNKPFAHFETVPLNDEVTELELDAIDQQFLETEAADEEIPAEIPVQEEMLEEAEVAEPTEVVKPIEISEPVELQSELIEVQSEPTIELQSEPTVEPVVLVPTTTEELVEEAPVPEEPTVIETPEESIPEPAFVAAAMDASSEEPSAEEASAESSAEPKEESESEEEDEEDDEETSKHSKYYWLLTTILVLLALGLGYFLGKMLHGKPEEVQVIMYDTIYIEKKVPVTDTLVVETEPMIKKDETTPPLKKPVIMRDDKAESKAQAKPEVKTPQQKAPEKKPEVKKLVEKKEAPKATSHDQYPQLPGGAYWIVGTAQTYKLRSGETIRIIAERFFGSRQMAHYIIKYNGVTDPDHVAEGTVLKIPKLEAKKK